MKNQISILKGKKFFQPTDWNLADTRRQEAELAKAFERLKLERLEWMPRSPPHDQQSTTSR
ncbi:hypothetical protein CFP56_027864 [Quercus suber]|uniref:Uncharacterized protein n=1 Tax=Quercus suber TaxID=58331 RepID=A0AAW0LVK8_QUESU